MVGGTRLSNCVGVASSKCGRNQPCGKAADCTALLPSKTSVCCEASVTAGLGKPPQPTDTFTSCGRGAVARRSAAALADGLGAGASYGGGAAWERGRAAEVVALQASFMSICST